MKTALALTTFLAALLIGTGSALATPIDFPSHKAAKERPNVMLLADDDDHDRRPRHWGQRAWHDDDRWDDDDDRWDDDDWGDDDDDDDDDDD